LISQLVEGGQYLVEVEDGQYFVEVEGGQYLVEVEDGQYLVEVEGGQYAKTGWLGMRIMCQSGATCLPFFSELVL
jgi:predicted  nucleic acid-binding Zn-ribbon protein